MRLALSRDDVVKFLMEVFSIRQVEIAEGAGLHTVPELLLIVQMVGYFEFHRSPSVFSAGAHGGLAGFVLRQEVDGADNLLSTTLMRHGASTRYIQDSRVEFMFNVLASHVYEY